MAAAFALILICLCAGHLCARFRVLESSSADAFNRFVIFVCLPALVLRLVPKLEWSSGLSILVIAPWFAASLSALLSLLAARIFRFSKPITLALLLCASLGNTSFLGFPLVSAILGTDALGFAVLYDQLGSFFILPPTASTSWRATRAGNALACGRLQRAS